MQFEDAPGDAGPEWKTERVPRIDEDSLSQLSDWSATDSEDQEQDADFSEDDFADFVNEAGWEDMGGDLTKRYNRLRQHVSASTANGSAAGEKSLPRSSGVLPAVNRPKTSNSVHSTKDHAHKSSAPIHASKVDSSLADLTHRFGAQLNLQPLHMQQNTTSTRKGGSEKVAHKDKSDRATTEQVLDPRTRLVLFKMLGRSLLSKIEGCISTGKEVGLN